MRGGGRRVLVCGAAGLLGQAVRSACAADERLEAMATTRAELDLTDTTAVRARLADWRPAVVINCAGYTDVDGAEREPELADLANRRLAEVLAAETARAGAALIQVSTDHVFDGRAARPYRPDDPARPVNVYGASKLAGEEAVRRRQPRAWIVRTSGLFGPGGRNFVDAISDRALRGAPLRVVADQICARTYTADLAAALAELAAGSAPYGTYHLTNGGASSWYAFACEIVARLGVTTTVGAVTSAEYGAPAARPAYSELDCDAWRSAGLRPLRPLDGALADYLSRRANPPTVGDEETDDA